MTTIFRAIHFTIAVLLIAVPWCERLRAQAQRSCSVEDKKQAYSDFMSSHEAATRDRIKALAAAKKHLACSADSGDQEEELARVNLAVGQMLSVKNLSNDAIPYFIRAASYNSTVKTSPKTYVALADAYMDIYEKLSEAYRNRYEGKAEDPQSLIALENIHAIIDRMIDAYARVVALVGVPSKPSDPHSGRDLGEWAMGSLTEFYRYRHTGSDRGLTELIATILSEPLPAWPIPPARAHSESGVRTSSRLEVCRRVA
ncbi:MAG TPA: hypothetical protein VE977_07550 [Pyrinomonadaceae bacterium]|nr:hypothetical protein [Pyrinomonadaceae bacterium]